MIEKQLTGLRRWAWLAAAILGVGFTILFGTLAIVAPAEIPMSARLGFVMGAIFGLAWAVLGIRVFRRRSLNLKVDTGTATGITWMFVVFMVSLFMVTAPNGVVGLRMILSGLVFLVMGVAFLIRYVIEQSELKTQEKLLEIEYRLAELAEIVRSDRPPRPTEET